MSPNNSHPTVVFYSSSQFSNTNLVHSLFNQKIAPSHKTGISFYHWIIGTSELCTWVLIDEVQEKNVYLNEAAVIVYCIHLSDSIDKKSIEQELADLLTKSAPLILLGINQNQFKINYPVKGQELNISEMKSISCEAFGEKILSLSREQKENTKRVNDFINLPKSSYLYGSVNALLEISKMLPAVQTKAIRAETERLIALLKDPEIADKISAIITFCSHCEKHVKIHSALMQALLFIAFVGIVTILAGTIGSGVGLIAGGMLLTKAAALSTCGAGLFSGLTLGSSLFYPQPRNESVMTAVNAVKKDALNCLS